MEEIIKKELEIHIRQAKKELDYIMTASEWPEDLVKLHFNSIRILVDYCERLCLEGVSAMEKW